MKAAYSFWTKPFLEYGGGYSRSIHFLAFLARSVEVSRQSFDSVVMYTDAISKPHFEAMGIFDEVIDSMGPIEDLPVRHWAASKLLTYSLQDSPFIHIDNDAYIGKIPSGEFDVLVQCPEPKSEFGGTYLRQIDAVENARIQPVDWIKGWYDKHPGTHIAFNTGVVGGYNIDFFKAYGTQAIDYLLEVPEIADVNTTIEQAYISVLAQVHGIKITTLLSGWRDKTSARAFQYRHFWGGTKRAIDRTTGRLWMDDVCSNLKKVNPDMYEKIVHLSQFFKKQPAK